MTNLPVEQVGESQWLAAHLQVEPDAKVMQSNFRSQACLKAIHGMWALTSQPEGIEQLVIDGLNDLAQPSQPASPRFGPAHFATLMGRADDLRTVTGLPVTMQSIPGEAFVGYIDALSWSADALQTRRGMLASGEKGLSQRMVIATGCGKAKAGDHAGRGNRGEQMEALIPANAIAPADIGLSGQPSAATSFRIACRNAPTVQCLIQTALRFHLGHQEQTENHDHIPIPPLPAIELLPPGQTP